MDALRRFQSLILRSLAVGFLLIGVVNTTVDPWRVLALPWTCEGLDPYRDVEIEWSRTSKTGLERTREWDGAIFGTSRVGSSLRPEHPAFGGLRIANLGLDGGPLWVSHALFRDFLDQHPHPRLVVFSVDVGLMYQPPPPADPADFAQSPLDPTGDAFERDLRFVLGFATFVNSVDTLFRWTIGRTPLHSTTGQRRWNGPHDRVGAVTTFLHVGVSRAGSVDARPRLDPEEKAIVEDVIARSQAAGARLVLMVPPDHVLLQYVTRKAAWPGFAYQEARRFLVEAVERANAEHPDAPPVTLWDFNDAHPLNCEPLPDSLATEPMHYWFDLVHIAPDLADLIVDRLMGGAGGVDPPYGTKLDATNVDAYLAGLGPRLDACMAAHPRDVAFVRETLGWGDDHESR